MFSLLVALLLLWLLARAVRALWRSFAGPVLPPAARASEPVPPPWTPYQSLGAPMPSDGAFVTGFVAGHWVAEHGHHHDDATSHVEAMDGDEYGDSDFTDDDCMGEEY